MGNDDFLFSGIGCLLTATPLGIAFGLLPYRKWFNEHVLNPARLQIRPLHYFKI